MKATLKISSVRNVQNALMKGIEWTGNRVHLASPYTEKNIPLLLRISCDSHSICKRGRADSVDTRIRFAVNARLDARKKPPVDDAPGRSEIKSATIANIGLLRYAIRNARSIRSESFGNARIEAEVSFRTLRFLGYMFKSNLPSKSTEQGGMGTPHPN